jgi:adenosylcobinamide-phosphate synthase
MVNGFARTLAVPAVAVAADLLWGEPPARLHPVVWMGRLIAALERFAPPEAQGATPRLLYGAGMAALAVAAFAAPAWAAERLLGRAGWPGALILGLLLKPAFAVRALLAATAVVGDALAQDDLPRAREGLRSLVSRDTAALPAPLLAAAAIESVTENTADSAVAPLLWFALWGLPGAVAYRVVNTLDAMVGYRTARYEHLGKASARLDDAANLVPARLAGLLFVLAAPAAGGDAVTAWRVMRRDRRITASPNAGWPMSAAAGALDVRLEKVGHYRLNPQGRPPGPADVAGALDLTRGALTLGLPLLAGLLALKAGRLAARGRR